jgi:hypothetical protein
MSGARKSHATIEPVRRQHRYPVKTAFDIPDRGKIG